MDLCCFFYFAFLFSIYLDINDLIFISSIFLSCIFFKKEVTVDVLGNLVSDCNSCVKPCMLVMCGVCFYFYFPCAYFLWTCVQWLYYTMTTLFKLIIILFNLSVTIRNVRTRAFIRHFKSSRQRWRFNMFRLFWRKKKHKGVWNKKLRKATCNLQSGASDY